MKWEFLFTPLFIHFIPTLISFYPHPHVFFPSFYPRRLDLGNGLHILPRLVAECLFYFTFASLLFSSLLFSTLYHARCSGLDTQAPCLVLKGKLGRTDGSMTLILKLQISYVPFRAERVQYKHKYLPYSHIARSD